MMIKASNKDLAKFAQELSRYYSNLAQERMERKSFPLAKQYQMLSATAHQRATEYLTKAQNND